VFSNTADPGFLAEFPTVNWCRVPAWRRRYLGAVFSFLLNSERAIRRAKPDLIHAQGLSCWSADVITCHMINAVRSRKLDQGQRRARAFSAIVTPVERAFYRQTRARQAIVMSRRLGQELAAEYGWRRPLSVIPHGTDTRIFRPPSDGLERAALRRELGVSVEGPLWLFVGEAVKGLQETLAQLPHFPEARLLVVSRSNPASYREQATVLGVSSRVTFAGFTSQPERVYRAADIFVYPSPYEPFGMVVTEAMASGLACIVGREVGAAELMTDGRDGLLMDCGDGRALRRHLELLTTDPAQALRVGVAARETIQHHDWNACAEATWRVYQAAAGRNRVE
jgi:glycosyltransferase involved in cell wall biosynthesis